MIKIDAPFLDDQRPATHLRQYAANILADDTKEKQLNAGKEEETDDERADLVYAVKVAIRSDGFVKIGMYGEVKL